MRDVRDFTVNLLLRIWKRLVGKYHLPVLLIRPAERLAALKKQADIYLINRENVQWLITESGIPFDLELISSGIRRWSVDFMEMVMSEILL